MTYKHVDQTYFDLINDVLTNGVEKSDRTGTGTISVFGRQCRYNLQDGFPILTSKRVHWKSVVGELLWFLKGDTNIKWLKENGISIWDEWADEHGNLGPVYGRQWRAWSSHKDFNMKFIDQIGEVINRIKNDPDSRRLIVSAWNVADLPEMALAPCHTMFQFYVADGKLSCQLYQRSADIFLGVPFNIASYAALTMMIAQVCDLAPGDFVHTLGDAHIYNNHFEQVGLQLQREPWPLPQLKLNPQVKDIFDFRFEDLVIENYDPHPHIKAAVAV